MEESDNDAQIFRLALHCSDIVGSPLLVGLGYGRVTDGLRIGCGRVTDGLRIGCGTGYARIAGLCLRYDFYGKKQN